MTMHDDSFNHSSLDDMFRLHGETVTYINGDVVPPEISAIYKPAMPTKRTNSQGEAIFSEAMLIVQATEVPTPKESESFTVRSESWSIKNIKPFGVHAWAIEIVKTNQSEISRPGYRQDFGRR